MSFAAETSAGDKVDDGSDHTSGVRDSLVLVWSGFLQQIKEREFLRSVRFAHAMVSRRPDLRFVFCLKPENFSDDYLRLADERIRICCTDHDEFCRILSRADFFFSPLWGKKCVGGPPLTWIESMAAGIPLITMNEEGVDEIIAHGENGLLFTNEAELDKALDLASSNGFRGHLSENARRTTKERFAVPTIAQSYMKLWESQK